MVEYQADRGDILGKGASKHSTEATEIDLLRLALSRALEGEPSPVPQIPRLKVEGHLVLALEQMEVLDGPFSFLCLSHFAPHLWGKVE